MQPAAMAAASAPGTYGAARPSEQVGDLAPPIKKRFFNRKRDRLGVMPSDKDFKDKLANALADSPAYNVLVEQQRQVDDLITRRRAQVRDSLQRLDRVARRLRITITNTHSNQPHAAAAPGSASPTHARPHAQPTSHSHSGSDAGQLPAEPPSWSLIIHGRVVEGAELVQHNQQAHPQPTGATDSAHAVKVVGVAGAAVQPTATTAGAAGGPAAAGVQQAGATAISLELDWQPPRFLLPGPLAEVLGVPHETLSRIMQLAHTHLPSSLKRHDAKNPGMVTLTPALAEVFHVPVKVGLETLLDLLPSVLKEMPAINVEHSIQINGPSPAPGCVLDVDFEVLPNFNLLSEGSMARFDSQPHLQHQAKEIENLDVESSFALRKLQEHRRRRTILMAFAQNPPEFLEGIVACQAREVRISKGAPSSLTMMQSMQAAQQAVGAPLTPAQQEAAIAAACAASVKEMEAERRTDLFRARWVEDAVVSVLQQKQAQRARVVQPGNP
ncbi:hypothetical protein V8C86DRAFT_458324 [Haematococcus lacustris]